MDDMKKHSDEIMQCAEDLLDVSLWEAEARMRAVASPTDETRHTAMVAKRSLVMAERRFQIAVDGFALTRSCRGDPVERPPERLVHEDTPSLRWV